jgi:hypothetical protein
MVVSKEDEVDYEPRSSCGRAFPSLEEFLEWEIHPPPALSTQRLLISNQEGRTSTLGRVKHGRIEEGRILVSSSSKGFTKYVFSAKDKL